MGFWDSLKNFGKKALQIGGSIIKKVGEIGAPILQKVAEWSPSVTGAIGTALDGYGAYTANPALIGLGETARALGSGPIPYYAKAGADWLDTHDVGKYGDLAYGLADKIK